MREPAVVSSPFVQRMSLSAIGTPSSPERPSRSRASASARAALAARAQEGVERRILAVDPVEVGRHELAAAHLTGVEQLDAPLGREPGRCRSCRGRHPEAAVRRVRGAPQSTSSRGQDGRDRSARTLFEMSSACAVGSTSPRSSFESSCTWPRIVESCSRIAPDLVRVQPQARQPGDVEDVGVGDRHRRQLSPRGRESADQARARTALACRPFGPCTTSNSTRWPSARVL